MYTRLIGTLSIQLRHDDVTQIPPLLVQVHHDSVSDKVFLPIWKKRKKAHFLMLHYKEVV